MISGNETRKAHFSEIKNNSGMWQ